MKDPFADITDETKPDAVEQRTELLKRASRTYVPVRKVFVQQPNEQQERASTLGAMVGSRQMVALRLFLLTLALDPLSDTLALPRARWAQMLTCTPEQFDRAVKQLEKRRLIARSGSRNIGLRVLLEDGSGVEYVSPTTPGAPVGKGFFVIPFEAWTSGLIDRLELPGLAMFLVCLHDTHQTPAFQVPLVKMRDWYGISERTAERGYNELLAADVLLTHPQTRREPEAPNGIRTVMWRALAEPYSKESRESLQSKARARMKDRTQLATSATTNPNQKEGGKKRAQRTTSKKKNKSARTQ